MRYTLSRNLMFSKTWQIQSNLRSILSSAPACLKVIVTVRDVKPRLVEEADSLGIKVVRSVRGRSSWKVKLAQPQVLGGGEVRGSAQAGGGSASSRHHRNHLLLKVSPLLLLIFNLLSHRLAAFGDTLLGKPKGVMLSHLNIVSATLACTHQLGQYAPNSQVGGRCQGGFFYLRCFVFDILQRTSKYVFPSCWNILILHQDILFSFLPLAHTLERCCELSVFMAGGAVDFNYIFFLFF